MKTLTAIAAAVVMMNLFIVAAISARLYTERVRPAAATALGALFDSPYFDDSAVFGRAFELTAYCPGPCCNTGTLVRNGVTARVDWSDRVSASRLSLGAFRAAGIDIVAVDPAVMPYGSLVRHAGRLYLALDRGSAIRGDRLDVLHPDHAAALRFGRRRDQPVVVFVPARPDMVVRAVEAFVARGDPF